MSSVAGAAAASLTAAWQGKLIRRASSTRAAAASWPEPPAASPTRSDGDGIGADAGRRRPEDSQERNGGVQRRRPGELELKQARTQPSDRKRANRAGRKYVP